MIKTLPLTFVFFLHVGALFSQDNGNKITGKVLDEGGWPVSYATVGLCFTDDTSKCIYTLTNLDGIYTIQVAKVGNCYLVVNHVIYEKSVSDTFQVVTQQSGVKRDFQLKEKVTDIQEISVIGEKSIYKSGIRRNSFEITPSVMKQVNSMFELMNQVPGITMDATGGIEVFGKTKILYLINGRVFQGGNPIPLLTPGLIRSIDVIKNVPPQYSSEGYTSVIDIKLINFNNGIKGFVNVSPPLKPVYKNSFNINYNLNKFRIYVGADQTQKEFTYTMFSNYKYSSYPDYHIETPNSWFVDKYFNLILGGSILLIQTIPFRFFLNTNLKNI